MQQINNKQKYAKLETVQMSKSAKQIGTQKHA